MTSDDTHSRTVELLESNSYFGMEPDQVKLLKQVHNEHCFLVKRVLGRCNMNILECYKFPFLQEKVACLDDNDARIAVDPRNKYRIQVQLLFFFFEKFCILFLHK